MKKLIAIAVVVALLLAMAVSAPVAAQGIEHHVYPGAGTPIQDAVDAAAPGDTIIVHAGTYNETVTIASDDYDLTLVGKDAVIADMADGSLLYGISLQAGCHHISISGFEIMDFDDFWDAGIEGWTGSDKPDWTFGAIHHITVHHNNIHDNYDGINIGAWDWSAGSPPSWRHNNITIHHNEVINNVDRGINLWAVSESNVNHNVIDDNGGDGLVFNHVSDSNANHNEIHGNDVVGLGVYNGATGNNFNNNDITNNDNLGILLTGWQYPTTGNTFVRNDARDNGSWDIRCIQQWGSQVYGNKWVKNKYDDALPDPPQ